MTYGWKAVCCYVVVISLCIQTSNFSLVPYGSCSCVMCIELCVQDGVSDTETHRSVVKLYFVYIKGACIGVINEQFNISVTVKLLVSI